MARSKEFDTTEVLHKAMEVFGHYGYEGTTLQNLLDGLGIARQSLYDTYGTKRDLFIKAVKHYIDEKSSGVVTYLDHADSAKKAIAEIFRTNVSALQDEERRKKCLILYSAIDQVPHDPEIAAIFERDRLLLENAFYEALLRDQSRGDISQNQDLHALARYLYHARNGLMQVAKLSNDPKALEDVSAVVLSTLDH